MQGRRPEDRSDSGQQDWFEVPSALRVWFALHGASSVLVGLPLLFSPEAVLRFLGWTVIDGGASRLVGAALVAIGLASYRTRFAGLAVFRAMLGLKIVWSGLGIVALFAAIGGGAPSPVWVLLFAFLIFFGVWTHYAIVFRRIASAGPEAFSYGDPRSDGGEEDDDATERATTSSSDDTSGRGAASS